MKKLLENIDVLLEDSFDASDVPSDFYMVFYLDPGRKSDRLEQLAKGKLEGVKGISGSSMIVIDFLPNGRNAILKMDGDTVVKRNPISRVMYSNHHYLMSNDMFAIRRLFNVSATDPSSARASAIITILHDFTREYKNDYHSREGKVAFYVKTEMWRIKKELKKESEPVNSVREMAKLIHRVTEYLSASKGGLDFDVRDWEKHLHKAIKDIGRDYAKEAEWILKDETLIVPKGSTLMIGLSNYTDKVEALYQEWKELKGSSKGPEDIDSDRMLQLASHKYWFEKREAMDAAIDDYGLDRRYRIRFVDIESIKRAQEKVRGW